MRGRMFTEIKAIDKVRSAGCNIDISPDSGIKFISLPKKYGVGIKTWGAIDYLTHGDNKPFTAYMVIL
tara:strand:+ start:140 stop:343 length:204 start_codon:yes stop_codon:yes gene_type:complete